MQEDEFLEITIKNLSASNILNGCSSKNLRCMMIPVLLYWRLSGWEDLFLVPLFVPVLLKWVKIKNKSVLN